MQSKLAPVQQGAALLCVALSSASCIHAQQRVPNTTIGLDFTTMREVQTAQYVGFGLAYQYLHNGWIGLRVEASNYPETQISPTLVSGFYIVQLSGAVLCGHRWKRVAVYGEGGYGVINVGVLSENPKSSFGSEGVRNLPGLTFGGLAEVPLSRSWGLTYEVLNNRFHSAPVPLVGGSFSNPFTLNAVEARIGIAFKFNIRNK